MMRQAGRYLPEYRAVRAKVDFMTLCKTPDLACEVTVQPVDILGVDAAVIFSDILVLLEAMGLPVFFGKDGGPKIERAIASESDIDKLHLPDIAKDLGYVGEAIRRTAAILSPRSIPVIGFAGAPFTLACYAVEGETSREFNRTKRFLQREPRAFAALLGKIAEGVTLHLRGQIEAGASVVQLFDTWGGILDQATYRSVVLPVLQKTISSLGSTGVPVVLYVNGSTPHLESMRDSGADVLSVDWRMPLSSVRQRVGMEKVLQGNLDPTMLYAPPDEIAKRTKKMIVDHGASKLIANLGHGMLPDIPVEHAKAFVEAIRNFK